MRERDRVWVGAKSWGGCMWNGGEREGVRGCTYVPWRTGREVGRRSDGVRGREKVWVGESVPKPNKYPKI